MIDNINNTQAIKDKIHSRLKGNEDQLVQPEKIIVKEGIKRKVKPIATVLGLIVFFVGSMGAVLITQKQRMSTGTVAPNAPASQPKADVVSNNCTLSFRVGELSCNSSCSLYMPTCPDGESCAEVMVDPCTEANSSYSCEAIEADGVTTNLCRLAANPSSETCTTEATPTPTATPSVTPTPTVTTTPTPTPTPTTTSTPTPTATGTITPTPTSTSTTIINTPTPTSDMTSAGLIVPEELPETGPKEWLQYLKVGAGALGIGALLILFL